MKSVFLLLLVAFATSCSSETKSQEPTQVVITNEDKTTEIEGSIELETVVVTKLDASGNVVSTFTDSVYFVKHPMTDKYGEEVWMQIALKHRHSDDYFAKDDTLSVISVLRDLKELKEAILDGYNKYTTKSNNFTFYGDLGNINSSEFSGYLSSWNKVQEYDASSCDIFFEKNEDAIKIIDFILDNIDNAELTASYSLEETPNGEKVKKTH